MKKMFLTLLAVVAPGVCLFLHGCFPISLAAQTSSPPAAKKVWTNDDLIALRATAPVSAPGQAPRPTHQQQRSDQSDAAERARKAQRYRQQLQPLYAELPKIDAELAQMHSFQDGSYQTTGGLPLRYLATPLNPADRINQLEKRKSEIQKQIGDIEDQARHDGVLPGDLR